MVDIANELGFPLIELPYEASFTDIMNPILAEVLNKQAALLTKSEETHRELMNILLAGGDLGDISAALARMVKNPVAIQDQLFNNTLVALKMCIRDSSKVQIKLNLSAEMKQILLPHPCPQGK